jgi:hypothetical protein
MRHVYAFVVAVVCALGTVAASGSDPLAMPLLERYASGEFDAVAGELATLTDFSNIYKDLRRNAPAWIDANGASDRDRRRLAAATFALEAARVGALYDWKRVQRFIRADLIYWRPPAELVEWGCALMRETPPTPIEQTWQLAALAVASRAQDFEFLIGSPWEGRANAKDEYAHLEHAAQRFPREHRFLLAQGIAIEWRLFPSARTPGAPEMLRIFANLRNDPRVGPEALMRSGVHRFRTGDRGLAELELREAEDRATDPFVTYLARFYLGQMARGAADAEAAYRGALTAVPRAQSATFALALLLAKRGVRSEGAALIDASLQQPHAVDPWRSYADADDRFWPVHIAALREAIAR